MNDTQTFEVVSSALGNMAGIVGAFKIYEGIHWFNDHRLQSAEAVVQQLPQLGTVCLRFLAEAIVFFNTNAPSEFPYLLLHKTRGILLIYCRNRR